MSGYRRSNGVSKAMVVAVALAAGAAASVHANVSPQVVRGGDGYQLVLPSGAVHASTSRIVNARSLEVGDGTVVALWDEVRAGGTLQHFYGVSLDGTAFNHVSPTEYLVRLKYASFDPLKGEPQVPAGLSAPAGNQTHLVQFVTPPLEVYRQEIEALGGKVQNFLTDHTHVVQMDGQTLAQVSALPYVRWVGPYHAAYKLEADIRADLASGLPELGPVRYSIETQERGPAAQGAIAAQVQALGGVVETLTPTGHRMEATLTQAQLLSVAAMNEVNFVDVWGPGGTDMDIIRQLGGAVPLLSNLGFLGEGVRGEIFDTEVNFNHVEFQSPQKPISHGTNGNSGNHGSSCYGINFASGVNTSATGLLPKNEQGIFAWYPQVTQFGGAKPRAELTKETVDPNGPYRAVFQTSSVGNPQTTQYTTISAEVDDYLFIYDLLSTQSQSNLNSQNSRPQAWAKNIVAVGGVQHKNTLTKTDDSASGASFGPAADGRMKPDLAHCYDSIFTTHGGGSYTNFGGTSGATPITSGHFGLMFQMWHEGVFPGFGGKSTVFDSRPNSATAKALMINSAEQYNWNAGGFNASLNRARQGWGMVHLGTLYNQRDKMLIVDETDILTPFSSKAYAVKVAAGEPALNVTMVFRDPKGNPGAAQARINDLTLKVTSPGGTVYWGNNGLFAGVTTPPGGVADTKDTVEGVRILNPQAGEWKIEVFAAEINQDGNTKTPALDAHFGLVASGVEVAGGCYADCDGNGVLNIDDFLCFQLKFALKDGYADCDGNSVFNIDDFLCYQLAFALGC